MTGSEVPGKASIGSWLAYGLGSESNDLPAFVVFTPASRPPATRRRCSPACGQRFPADQIQRRGLRGQGDPVLYVKNPPGVDPTDRRTMLDALNKLNQINHGAWAIPRSRRASRNTRWPSACRPACPSSRI
jgi:hypothetical protein